MNWYFKCLKQYVDFSGRARRKEYWFFFLFNFIISFVLGLVDGMAGTADPEIGLGLIGGIYTLAVLLPGMAVSVRRLHDTGRSGWSLLFGLIPLVGAIILLVFYFQDSDAGPNEYGENPKAN